jgi:hypothetical protein
LSRIEVPRPPSRRRTVSLIPLALLVLVAAGALAILLQRDIIRLPHRPPRVTGYSPADGAQDVSTGAAIRITFSQPMGHAGTEARFQIDPPIDGRFAWTEETLTYDPTGALVPGSTYTVTLDAGAPSQYGRGTLAGSTWRFYVGQPQLLYMARDEAGHFQLYLAGDPPAQLSAGEADVWGYAVHPEGTSVVYSVDRGDGGAK